MKWVVTHAGDTRHRSIVYSNTHTHTFTVYTHGSQRPWQVEVQPLSHALGTLQPDLLAVIRHLVIQPRLLAVNQAPSDTTWHAGCVRARISPDRGHTFGALAVSHSSRQECPHHTAKNGVKNTHSDAAPTLE
jgi:hypothetical protein